MDSLQSPNYVFCCNQNLPKNLIMLQKSDKILQVLLASPDPNVFLWLNNNSDRQISTDIQDISSKLKMQIIQYKSTQLLISHIQDKRFSQNLLIICPPEKMHEISKLNKIMTIICYPYEQSMDYSQIQNYIYYAQNVQQLLEILQHNKNENKTLQYKWLPNFIHLNSQVSKSSSLVITLAAMINCQNDQITRNLIIYQLQKLFQQMKEYEQHFKNFTNFSKQFIKQLKAGSMSYQRSIYWYTLESPIFKFVNNLLRSTESSCLIFYIQPYFKIVFNAIQTLYKKQKQLRQFVCFRGGKITKQEIQRFEANVGCIVQNLGFLSTTLEKQVSQNYIQNVHFIVIVNEEQKTDGFGFGYANISQYSQYFSQSEILFNPLNFFKIISIKQRAQQQKNFYQIELQFRGSKKLGNQRINENQRINLLLIQKQKNYIKTKQYQGIGLVNGYEIKQGGIIYWKKLTGLAKKYIQKFLSLENISQHKQKNKEENIQINSIAEIYICGLEYIALVQQDGFEQALKLFKQLELQLAKNNSQRKISAQIYSRIANIHLWQNKFDLSLQYFSKAQQIIIDKFGFYYDYNAAILQKKAKIFSKQFQLQKALNCFKDSMEINEQCFGKCNFQNLQILYGIASIYLQQQEYYRALQYFDKYITAQIKIFGYNTGYVANSLLNIAIICQIQGNFQKALNLYQEVLKIQQTCYGIKSAETAHTLVFLGNFYLSLKLYQIALQHFLKAMQIIKKFHRQQTQQFIELLISLGYFYKESNKINQSLFYYQKARQIILKLFGEKHINHALNMVYIAEIYLQKGQVDYALEVCLKYRNMDCIPKKHSLFSKILFNIGKINYIKGNFHSSLQLFEQSLQNRRQIYGLKHYKTVPNLINLSAICLHLLNFTKALQYCQQAEVIQSKFYGVHPKYADIVQIKASLYIKKGDYKQALIYQRKAQNCIKKFFGKDSIQFYKSLLKKANLYKNIGQYIYSLKAYKYILNKTKSSHEQSVCYQRQSVKSITEIYIQIGNIQQARGFLNNNQAILQKKHKIRKRLKKLFKKAQRIQINPTFVDY